VEVGCNGVDDDCDPTTPDEVDGDGDGVACDEDCDDADPERAPNLEEVCGNGVDEDCVGGADDGCDTGPTDTGVLTDTAAGETQSPSPPLPAGWFCAMPSGSSAHLVDWANAWSRRRAPPVSR
jgi:hypothetical protein